MTDNKKDETAHTKLNPGTTNQPPVDEFIFRNKETPPTQDNLESHETIIPNSLEKESKLDVPNTKFTGYPARSLQMQMKVRKQREAERVKQIKQLVSSNFEQSHQLLTQSTPHSQTIVPKPRVHFADERPCLPNGNLENTQQINTISLISEENFSNPTNCQYIASTKEEQAEFASSPEIAQIAEIELPENIAFEENQIVFEEPSISVQEIKVEKDEIKIETNKSETQETRNKEAVENNKEDEKPLVAAQVAKFAAQLLGVVPLIEKCTTWITKTWSTVEAAKKRLQLSAVKTEIENAMETETHNAEQSNDIEQSNDVATIDEHEEPNNDSNPNTNNEELITMFAQNAMQFSKPNNNLSIEGSICGKKYSFLVDTGANVSAIKADVWRQLPPPTKHPPKPTNSIEELANNKKFSFKTAELEENDENLVPDCVLAVLFLLIWRSIALHPILNKELMWLLRKHEREKSAVIAISM